MHIGRGVLYKSAGNDGDLGIAVSLVSFFGDMVVSGNDGDLGIVVSFLGDTAVSVEDGRSDSNGLFKSVLVPAALDVCVKSHDIS